MYRWPQGRIVRISAMLLAALIAVDIGYNGAYASFEAYRSAATSSTRALIVAIVYGSLAAGVLFGVLGIVAFHRRAVDFLVEVEEEMRKVDWPNRSTLTRSTVVIAIAATILVGLILGVDLLNISVLEQLRKLGEG